LETEITVVNGATSNFVSVPGGTTYTVNITPGADGIVTVDVAGGVAQDGALNGNMAATQFSITYDTTNPTVVANGVNSVPDTGDGILTEGETARVGISKLLITFSKEMSTTIVGDEVTNADNYLLLSEGAVAGFQTLSCSDAKTTGVDAGDTKVTISSVTYDNGSSTANLNLASSLPNGIYRLYACGTATLRDLAGNPLNGGEGDFVRNFQVRIPVREQEPDEGIKTLPLTGFPMGRVTKLPLQPAEKAYASTDLVLEIPALQQKLNIVGVPLSEGTWDVSWLGNSAGYLAGSAYPTWAGNTVLTAHVWDAYNNPGPFANLKELKYGDIVKIYAFGQVYTYEVRESRLVTSSNVTSVLKHEKLDWVTLLSCEYYNPAKGNYLFRRMVRAVLVKVEAGNP